MKLKRIQVLEFQSIRDTNPFDIGDITCLVGKNEAGKTSILKALYKLNPIVQSEGTFDVTEDYPRMDVDDYQIKVDSGEIEPAKVIKAYFELDQEIEEIEDEFGPMVFSDNQLTLTKGYDNVRRHWVNLNEKEALKFVIKTAGKELKSLLKETTSFKDANQIITDTEIEEENEEIVELLSNIGSGSFVSYIVNNYIDNYIPKFLYFDSYYQLTGQENINTLIDRIKADNLKPSDYPMLGLLSLARIEINQLLDPKRTQELVNKLEGAGNHLSKQVLKYWSQNKHLQMKFDVRPGLEQDPEGMQEGTNVWAKVYDSKRWVTTNLNSRSKGFVWFFSFLSWYSKIRKEGQNVVLLLDEPGLYLHAKAQGDLLHYFEQELKPHHQLLYSTHSPFMIDSTNFDRVRIVQDISIDSDEDLPKDEDGTKVINDFSQATDDSLFPLQGALGYEIHQTLFIGPNSLIVEGTSDLLYIQTISGFLDKAGRESLSNDWTITPVGGSDKVPTFVALLGSQKKMNIATLIDFQKKDQQQIENLFRKKLLSKKNVMTFADFSPKDEADIEDMFEEQFYVDLFNSEYKNELAKKVTHKELKSQKPRILQKLEDKLESEELGVKKKFSHYRPARYFAENISKLEKQIDVETLNRFESIFKKLNSLI